MANKRILYAIQQVGIAPLGTTSMGASHTVHGVQSVGMTTNFNLEQIFELGQIAIYENIENVPDIEVTLEKVLDGYPLIYHLATRGAPSATLTGRGSVKCMLALSIFDDTKESSSGNPISEVVISGAYVSSLTYTFPVDGNCMENVTIVCNNKTWRSAAPWTFVGQFNNTDEPLALTGGLGGIQRREDVLFGSGNTVLPADIPGINVGGDNPVDAAGDFGAHLQTITVNCDLGREQLFELGRRAPFHRYINFPVEVTCEIEVLAHMGDMFSATEAGTLGNGNNLLNRIIFIKTRDGTKLDLGNKNKLASVNYGGGDAGGGNVTCTYSYSTYNQLTITHPQDPTVGLAA